MPEFGPWTLDCGLWTVDSGLWTDPDRENVRTIPAAVAIGAADEDVAGKLHFDLFEARAPAAFTLALAGVEAEGAGVQTPLPGGLGLGKKLADVIEGADIDSGIGARRFAQYGLVNQDDAAEMLPPLDEGGGARAGSKTSRTSVVLPEPLTPVIPTNLASGISTVRSLRLCFVACARIKAGEVFHSSPIGAGASFRARALEAKQVLAPPGETPASTAGATPAATVIGRRGGISICLRPLRYWPVREPGDCKICAQVPWKTT